jgi:hypothetical protein
MYRISCRRPARKIRCVKLGRRNHAARQV